MKHFTFLKTMLLAVVMLAGSVGLSGITVNHVFTSISGNIDENISFTTEKNSAQSVPAYNASSSELRIYYSSNGNGGSITLTAKNGAIITDFKLTASSASYTPTVKYQIDGGADQTNSWSSTIYEVNGINVTDKLKIRNANTSNTQLRLKSIEITYTTSSTPCTPSNLAFSSETVSKNIADEPFTITPTSLNETTPIAYTSSDVTVATVDAATGEVAIVGAGVTTITASQEAGTHNGVDYCAGTSSYELTVEPIAAPVALAATDIKSNGFTANWDAVEGATEYVVDVYTKSAGTNATDLFISEYVEGSSYNKAIEIYNGTGVDVDLSNYSLKKQVNGAGEYGSELKLSGTLANNDVYVIAYVSSGGSASDDILAVTDLQTNSGVVNFNGNDAVALFKDGVQIDEVGIFNNTSNWGADLTLIRKNTITSPNVTYDVNDWDTEAKDYIDNLGSHTMAGGSTTTSITDSPFTVTNTSHNVTGLTPETEYFYTVKAKAGAFTSAVSNEISVTTLKDTGTGLDNTSIDNAIWTAQGKVMVNAKAGELVEIYNVSGQKLVSRLATYGLNSINVAAKGVLIVKAGNQTAKVIL